ncbi:hypothetical protein [Pseudomonas yamanorum]|jgi:hypothetical protein|uniref:hypothetical protein n=2 Tax=Pseudomonas yamanorum TaxID=515393 RepID=UPI003BA08C3C
MGMLLQCPKVLNRYKKAEGKYPMSKLSALIAVASAGLSLQERIPDAKWMEVAKHCGREEVADIQKRIESLKAELVSVEGWDCDTQDEINATIFRFSNLLKLATDDD